MRTNKRRILKIGYRDYVLKFVKNLKGIVGDCTKHASGDWMRGEIRIIKGLNNTEKANTIIHEIGHAIFDTQGITVSPKLEEQIVNAFTNGLIDFIKANPEEFDEIVKLIK